MALFACWKSGTCFQWGKVSAQPSPCLWAAHVSGPWEAPCHHQNISLTDISLPPPWICSGLRPGLGSLVWRSDE